MRPLYIISFALVFTWVPVAVQAQPAQRVDRYGDPLPQGAIARLGTIRFRGRSSTIYEAASLSPDGRLLVVGPHFFDAKSGRRLGQANEPIALTPDGKSYVTPHFADFALFDLETHRRLRTFSNKSPEGHSIRPWCIAVSPNGKQVAVGGDESRRGEDVGLGVIRRWDMETGRQLAPLVERPSPSFSYITIQCLAWSLDSKLLGAGTHNEFVRVWNVSDLRLLDLPEMKLDHYGASNVSFSPDGKYFAALGGLACWNLTSREKLKSPEPVLRYGERDFAISVDGRMLAAGSERGEIVLRTFPELAPILTIDLLTEQVTRWADGPIPDSVAAPPRRYLAIYALAFSPDGKTLYSASHDHVVRLWDVETGKRLDRREGHESDIISAAISPDNKLVAVADQDRVLLWDLATSQVRYSFDEARPPVAFSPDGRVLISGSQQQVMGLWDVDSGKPVRDLPAVATPHDLRAAVTTSDGTVFAVGTTYRDVRLWKSSPDERLRTFFATGIQETPVMAVSTDGKTVVTGHGGGAICFWQADQGGKLAKFKQVINNDQSLEGICSLALSPDGRLLASGSCHTPVIVRDTRTGEIVQQFDGRSNVVRSLAFTGDGKYLASGDTDGVVRVWDIVAGKKIATLRGHDDRLCALAFSRDGSRLVSGGNDTAVLVWDTAAIIGNKAKTGPAERSTNNP